MNAPLNELIAIRKLTNATQIIRECVAEANGDQAAAVRAALPKFRKDADLIEGLLMHAVAMAMDGDRDGVGAGPVACAADVASRSLPASAPTNSGAEGHAGHASVRGPQVDAPAPLPERGEEGHCRDAPESAGKPLPTSPLPLSKNTGGAGHAALAPARLGQHARPPVPFRKPSSIELLAARKVENAAASSIFKTFMVRGRSIGSYTFGELKHTEYQSLIEAAVCRRIRRYAPMTYDKALVSAVIDEKQLKKFIDDATKEIDDAA